MKSSDFTISIVTRETKSLFSCPPTAKEGHVCHSECLSEAGCWGPGPAMCAHCCTFEADGVCVSKCSDAPGFYLPPSSNADSPLTSSSGKFRCPTLPLTSKQIASMPEEEVLAAVQPARKCARCHEECAETCTGPGANECEGECNHFRVSQKYF